MSIAKIVYHIAYMDMRPTFEDEPGNYVDLEGPPPEVSGKQKVESWSSLWHRFGLALASLWHRFGRVRPAATLNRSCRGVGVGALSLSTRSPPPELSRNALSPIRPQTRTFSDPRSTFQLLRASKICARTYGPQSLTTAPIL